MNFVVFHSRGPKWPAGGVSFDHPEVKAHAGYFRELFQKGEIVMGGPFPKGGGGMMVFRKDIPESEVHAYASKDPAVESGIMSFELRAWMAIFQ